MIFGELFLLIRNLCSLLTVLMLATEIRTRSFLHSMAKRYRKDFSAGNGLTYKKLLNYQCIPSIFPAARI